MIVFASLASADHHQSPSAASPKPPRHVLISDDQAGHVIILDEKGDIRFRHPIRNLHDLHVLPNGNYLFQTDFQNLIEVTPDNQTVWTYNAGESNGNAGKRVEVHAFQPLPSGNIMIAESGPARIIEIDRAGNITHQIKLTVNNPNPHTDTRLARKLPNGNYLVAHASDGAVREYNPTGQVVWEYNIPLFGRDRKPGHDTEAFGNEPYAALRLPNGNTLISTGNGHSVLEVTPDKQIAWAIHQNDLPGITLAWVTTLQVLPNGNVLIGNCHAGPSNPQLIEVNRDKQVLWTLKDHTNLADATTNSILLNQPGSIH